jgi:Flp pilus assembly pilin Flp
MQRIHAELGRFWAWLNRSRRAAGQGLVEYALILVLIAVVIVGAMTFLGKANNKRMANVACRVENAGVNDNPNCP